MEGANEALNIHVRNLGGEVKNQSDFDPYKAAIGSTTFDKLPIQR